MNKIKLFFVFACICLFQIDMYAQVETEVVEDDIDSYSEEMEEGSEFIEETFTSTRVINGHSTETLEKNTMEFRVEHRFGDVAGLNGGVQTMFGFDNVADIRLGFEYGLTDNFMIGIGRSKGTGAPYRSLMDGFAKYRLLRQKKEGMPISLSFQAGASFTYMKKLEDLTEIASFPEWQHRLSYFYQLSIAKKFGKRFSLLISPTVVHRNYVLSNDVNTLFAIGGASRISIKPTMSLIFEYYHALHNTSIRAENTNSLGVAMEFETFGHIFTINLTNSRGFGETQFIPFTFSNWMDGEFRLGFTIGRKYAFGH